MSTTVSAELDTTRRTHQTTVPLVAGGVPGSILTSSFFRVGRQRPVSRHSGLWIPLYPHATGLPAG
jgi:hypothetical protein